MAVSVRWFMICMFRYRFEDQVVPAMCLNLAVARLRHESAWGKAPTTRVLRKRPGKLSITHKFHIERVIWLA